MPLPFILAGAAVAAAGFGTKKGYDGYQDKAEANDILERSKRRYEQASEALEQSQEKTYKKLDQLGLLQIGIGEDLNKFQNIAEKLLKKLNNASSNQINIDIPEYQRKRIEKLSLGSVAYASKIAGGAAGGAAAAYAVYGGVMALATASTGTSIATLSGVAASNAALAAIGGGSLAAGGFGMAGGAAILGGIVAAPVIAVAGWAFASHAEEALSEAKESRREVNQFVEKAEISQEYLVETHDYVGKIIVTLSSIRKIFEGYLDSLGVVEKALKSGDTTVLDRQDDIVQAVGNGYAIAAILTDIITTPLFKMKKENGNIIYDDAGVPQLITDDNGVNKLNKEELEEVIHKSASKTNIDIPET